MDKYPTKLPRFLLQQASKLTRSIILGSLCSRVAFDKCNKEGYILQDLYAE